MQATLERPATDAKEATGELVEMRTRPPQELRQRLNPPRGSGESGLLAELMLTGWQFLIFADARKLLTDAKLRPTLTTPDGEPLVSPEEAWRLLRHPNQELTLRNRYKALYKSSADRLQIQYSRRDRQHPADEDLLALRQHVQNIAELKLLPVETFFEAYLDLWLR